MRPEAPEALSVSYQRLSEEERRAARLSPAPIPVALFEALGPEVSSLRVRSAMVARSFVTPVPTGEVPLFGLMHRVLADFRQSQATEPEEECRRVCDALTEVMTPNACQDPNAWPLMNAHLPHAEWLFERMNMSGLGDGTESAVYLGLAIGILLRAQGLAARARMIEEQTVALAETFLGPEHPDTLTSMNNLAVTLFSQGDLSGARALHEKALEARKRLLGEEHPGTTVSVWNLFLTLLELGDVTAMQEVLNRDLLWLFSRNPATLAADQRTVREQLLQMGVR